MWDKFKKRLKGLTRTKSSSLTKTEEWRQLAEFLGISNVSNGELSEATYFACMKLLGESIGKLPLKTLEKSSNGGTIERTDLHVAKLLRYRPNRFMTATTFWTAVENNRNHYGNAYVLMTNYGTEKMELFLLPSKEVTIYYDNAKVISELEEIWYVHSHNGKRALYSSAEIMHFKSFLSFDGISGVSIRDQLRGVIDGNNDAQKMQNKLFKNGFTARTVLQYTSELNDNLKTEMTQMLDDYAKGKMEDSQGMIPVPLGIQLTPLNTSLADNQFLDLKKYSAIQICNAFGIKAVQINDLTKASYASTEAQNLAFYIDTLLFNLKQYEEEITYKAYTKKQQDKNIKAKFNVNVILRADAKTQMEYLTSAVSNFVLTPDEAREQLDLPSKPGGDQLIGNGATIPLTKVGTQYEKRENEKEKGGQMSG